MTTKPFHIGTILSITDGKLISPDGIGGVYQICDHMTGDTNFTHQLPRVAREIEPHLRAQFPDLAAIVVPDTIHDEPTMLAYLQSLEAEYGTHRDVEQMPAVDHTPIDPIAELALHHPGVPVVAVEIDPED
jgi:hypothetical protein